MEPNTVPTDKSFELSDDILRGADEIAEFIFGDRADRRKVYYLAECTKLPIFRLGSVFCARRSVLMNWIAAQEVRATPPSGSGQACHIRTANPSSSGPITSQ